MMLFCLFNGQMGVPQPLPALALVEIFFFRPPQLPDEAYAISPYSEAALLWKFLKSFESPLARLCGTQNLPVHIF
jgi:hypothetical protein